MATQETINKLKHDIANNKFEVDAPGLRYPRSPHNVILRDSANLATIEKNAQLQYNSIRSIGDGAEFAKHDRDLGKQKKSAESAITRANALTIQLKKAAGKPKNPRKNNIGGTRVSAYDEALGTNNIKFF